MPGPLLLAAPATIASLAYLNGKYHVGQDLNTIYSLYKSTVVLTSSAKQGRLNLFYKLEENARNDKTKNHVFIIYQAKRWTYKDFYEAVLRYGTWLCNEYQVKQGEIIAMVIGNSDTFALLWFAIWSLGAIPAFINYNLSGKPLWHSIRSSTTRLVLVEPEFISHFDDALQQELPGVTTVCFNAMNESAAGRSQPSRQPDQDRYQDQVNGMAILIYTSGTTGLPKPAIVSWNKATAGGSLMGRWMEYSQDDVFYTAMPLYHTSAAVLGVLTCLLFSSTICIGRKFSTKTFWPDVRASNATVIQYVGETCRYLLSAPPSPLDQSHKVRLAFGNGLRPDVWNQFKSRFGIEAIAEFYSATEGAGAAFNYSKNDFAVGAIGRTGKIFSTLLRRGELVEVDHETELPLRDTQTKLCRKVKSGDPGEMIYKLDAKDIKSGFQGYFNNDAANESKILRDVFVKGDAYFRTGDILRQDSEGRTYFSDRIGDTYRWKGENVSTNQVAEIFTSHPAIVEANVYGIELPHHDGRAGCAQLVLRNGTAGLNTAREVEMKELGEWIASRLPRYAVPGFVRISKGELERTGTNKYVKGKVRGEGADPDKISGTDEIWWLRDGGYVRFEKSDWADLVGGTVKL